MINNLSVYKSPYIFWKVFTSLGINDLSVYTNVKVVVAMILTDGNGLFHGFRQREINKLSVKLKTIRFNPPQFSTNRRCFY